MSRAPRRPQAGLTLIEVLVSLVVTVIGLLGLVGLQMRSYQLESESYQRSQALVLLADMVSRMEANRTQITAYVAAAAGTGPAEDCGAPAASAAYDLCQWGNLLRGAAHTSDGNRIGAMARARGCITAIDARTYVVAVAWEGTVETGPPDTACGKDQFSSEKLRRGVTRVVHVGNLN